MKYRDISYSMTSLELADGTQLSSTYGAAISVGKTFRLHKKPILGLLSFGIDATWVDLNYANYEVECQYYDGKVSSNNIMQAEYSMHIGPSVTLLPNKKISVNAYLRYAPTFSAVYVNESIYSGYVSNIVSGACVTFKSFGIGIEQRIGNCTYSVLGDSEDVEESLFSLDGTTSLSNMRAYITFRF
ncbi:MAG: hypothetical protein SNJ20_09050 [Rikenellaceae bacterium]